MEINFEELMEGSTLEKSIVRKDGTLILNKGTVLTRGIIDRLRKLKNVIKYDGEENSKEDEIEETVEVDLRHDTEDDLNEFLNNPTATQIQKVKENLNKIVENIKSSGDPQYDLEMYSEQPQDNFSHDVRVACFSILLAKLYNDTLKNPNKQELINLRDIAVAAALKDVGVIYKDSSRLSQIKEIPNVSVMEPLFPGIKDTPLDHYDEKYSSVYSYCAVANMENVSNATKLMILLSKEPENEKGALKIPTSISSRRNSIIYAGKIINVCNVYDNAMKQAIDNNVSLENVVAELGQSAVNGMISNEIKELLINKVKLYPYKTRVILSNGQGAVVEESRVGQYDSYKPVVYTRPYPGKKIDLRESTNITIKSVLSKSKFKNLMKDQIEDMKNIASSSDSGR